MAGNGRKQRENFGPPTFRASPSGPHPSGPHPSGPHPSGPTLLVFVLPCFVFSSCCYFFEKEGQKTETPILAEVGLAKVGQIRVAKVGFGQSRSRPKSVNEDVQSRFGQSRLQPCDSSRLLAKLEKAGAAHVIMNDDTETGRL